MKNVLLFCSVLLFCPTVYGQFSGPNYVEPERRLTGISTADFNSDGNLDLMVAGYTFGVWWMPNATLRVLDARANLLKSEVLPAGINHLTLDLNSLPAGLYFLDIQVQHGKRYSGKLLKI